MIITDEPGVYEAGQVGIRIENELECYPQRPTTSTAPSWPSVR